jgi:hypothetical protein
MGVLQAIFYLVFILAAGAAVAVAAMYYQAHCDSKTVAFYEDEALAANARADAAERSADAAWKHADECDAIATEMDSVRQAWMWECERLKAELRRATGDHSGRHELGRTETEPREAIKAEVVDMSEPFYKQLHPVAPFDMSMTGGLHIPADLYATDPALSEPVAS